jgi:COP9 signalosome complex subunit 4
VAILCPPAVRLISTPTATGSATGRAKTVENYTHKHKGLRHRIGGSHPSDMASTSSISLAISARDVAAIRSAVDVVLTSETVDVSKCRETLRHLTEELRALPVEDNEFIVTAASEVVERIRSSSRASALDSADFLLRSLLWESLSGEGDYERAATALSGARALREEAGGSTLVDESRAHAFVRITQSHLSAGKEESAADSIRRAGEIIDKEGVDISWKVQLMYKTCVARVLDSKRRFHEAALRYAELARLPSDKVDESDLIVMLEKAVNCILLAPFGASRQCVMASLMRDERISLIDVRYIYARCWTLRVSR